MSTRVHMIVTFGGRAAHEDGTVMEVMLGDHAGFGLCDGPPYFAVLEAEVPGGDEVIAQSFNEDLDSDNPETTGRRFKLEVGQLSKAQRDEMKRPGSTHIPWGQIKSKMKDKKNG